MKIPGKGSPRDSFPVYIYPAPLFHTHTIPILLPFSSKIILQYFLNSLDLVAPFSNESTPTLALPHRMGREMLGMRQYMARHAHLYPLHFVGGDEGEGGAGWTVSYPPPPSPSPIIVGGGNEEANEYNCFQAATFSRPMNQPFSIQYSRLNLFEIFFLLTELFAHSLSPIILRPQPTR